MTTTQLTVESAPRDLAGLKNVGRFNLRSLATQLGVFENEEHKTAFMQGSNDQQAETILALLLKKDGKAPTAGKGGGGAPSGRSPSTKNAGGKAAAGTTKPAGEAAAGTGGGGGAAQGTAAGSAVGAGAEKILKAITDLSTKYDGIKESIDNLTERVGQLEGISAGTNRFVALSIGLNLKLAEQVLGAGPDQILEIVLEDMPIVEAAMAKMAPVGEGDDEAEDETDEGNEE